MSKRTLPTFILSLIGSWGLVAQAASLAEVYEEAKANDPTFQIAYHTWLAAQGDPDIALSSVLPQIDLSGDRSFTHYDLETHDSFGAPSYTFGVSIEQTLFDWNLWKAYRSAKVGHQMALVTLRIAAQDLLYRTTNAYFDVLTSIQTWQSNKKLHDAYLRQYQTTKHKFDAGTATKADLFDAKAQADNAKSTLITSKATMDTSVASLYTITGKWHNTFKGLSPKLKTNRPMPNHSEAWEKLALAQNMMLEYSRLGVKQARLDVQKQIANHFPTVSMTGSFNRTSTIVNPGDDSIVRGNARSILFTASQPIWHGGGILAADKQAKENLKVAEATRLQSERAAIEGAFSAFLKVNASIDSVEATKEALTSSQVALDSTKNSYQEGINTLTDVLFAISTWNTANISYISTRYTYLLNTLLLKQSVGALSVYDLSRIDGLLTDTVTYPSDHHKHMAAAAAKS